MAGSTLKGGLLVKLHRQNAVTYQNFRIQSVVILQLHCLLQIPAILSFLSRGARDEGGWSGGGASGGGVGVGFLFCVLVKPQDLELFEDTGVGRGLLELY